MPIGHRFSNAAISDLGPDVEPSRAGAGWILRPSSDRLRHIPAGGHANRPPHGFEKVRGGEWRRGTVVARLRIVRRVTPAELGRAALWRQRRRNVVALAFCRWLAPPMPRLPYIVNQPFGVLAAPARPQADRRLGPPHIRRQTPASRNSVSDAHAVAADPMRNIPNRPTVAGDLWQQVRRSRAGMSFIRASEPRVTGRPRASPVDCGDGSAGGNRIAVRGDFMAWPPRPV